MTLASTRLPPDSRARRASRTIDRAAAQQAVRALLLAMGEDPTSDALRHTPRRVVDSFAELVTPPDFQLTSFPNDDAYDQLVVVRDIPFASLCEHHLLPFTGSACVAYLPGRRILGLSKLARVVELFSRRLQVQERLTNQVAHWLDEQLAPRGVGVVLKAEHMCMTVRGVRAAGATTVTSAVLGAVRDDSRTRAEFMSLVR